MQNEAYQKLMDNLCDIVAEEQAKLGYMKEPIRLYYPLSSLNHFFGGDVSADEMQEKLSKFKSFAYYKFGEVEITHKGERFCFFLSERATEYVHENGGQNQFIFDLVALLAKHGTVMEEVEALFAKQKDAYEIEKMNHGEFDYMIHFVDSKDKYLYCFKDEGCHIIYHRFLPEDYEDLGL